MSNCPSTKPAKKCCEIPVLPTCPPKDACSCKVEAPKDNCEKAKPKCPPMPTTDCSACKPKWINCSPNFTKMYPVPDGVTIQPISVGGRNGGSKGACGKCGQDKPSGKPKVSANCPMMRPKCPGLEQEKSPGLFAKLASLFGKDLENDASSSDVTKSDAGRLESVCKSLQVEDEKIRHHRNVFNPELVVRRDGYICPLLKKVDCVAVARLGQNFQAHCKGESDKCPPPPPSTCPSSTPPPPPPPEPEVVPDCPEEEILEEVEDDCLNYEEDEDDECVEDVEGECIIDNAEEVAPEEETASVPAPPEEECTDKVIKDNSCNCSCVPMSNFVIRVQAPFSEGSSETCETIVDRLCKSRGAMYPEPPEIQPQSESDTDPDCNDNLKVIEIKEEPVTFVCVNPAPSKPPPQPSPPVTEALPPPPPTPTSCCSAKIRKPVEPAPSVTPPTEPTPEPAVAETKEVETTPKCEPPTKSPEESRKLPPPPCPCSPFAAPEAKKCHDSELVDPPEIGPVVNKCTNPCIKCGQLKCDCNQELKGHLKECAGLGVLPEVSPLLKKCKEVPPPAAIVPENKESNQDSSDPWDYEAKPLCWDKKKDGNCGPSCNSGCDSVQNLPQKPPAQCDTPKDSSTTQEQIQPTPEPAVVDPCPETSQPQPPPPPTLEPPSATIPPMSATEMCRANIASLMCTQCPPPIDKTEDTQEKKEPEWTSPPPPSCTHCGAATRGDNEDCYMCTFTRRARDPYRYDWICPSVIDYKVPETENPCFMKEEPRDKCDSDEFDMTPEGKPVYEGGMCMKRAQYFLWKTNPCPNSLKGMGFENQCYGFRRCAKCVEGEGVEEECVCLPKYKGGMSIDEYQEFIWKRTSLETAPKPKSNKMFNF